MVHKIFIVSKIPDARENIFLRRVADLGFSSAKTTVKIISVYSVKKNLNRKQVFDGAEMLANPVVQKYYLDSINDEIKFDWAIEIGFLPGVTDNVGNTTTEMISDNLRVKFSQTDHVYTSRIYCLSGKFTQKEIRQIANTLYNPIIERAIIADAATFSKLIENKDNIPEVKLKSKQTVDTVNLHCSDAELSLIGKSGIASSDGSRRGPLALSLSYMKAIQEYFSGLHRNPTDIELESIAQTW
jgi:phosphoribosylformylglycinamidine (FGAM) synthase PurS component